MEADAAALQAALDKERPALQAVAAKPDARAWVDAAASTDGGSVELYALLEDRVSRPGFEAALADARRTAAAGKPAPAADGAPPPPVAREAWWAPPPSADDAADPAAASSPSLVGGAYVVVTRDDVADAVAHFIATYLATLPDASRLPPPALAAALKTTFAELRRGKLVKLWGWGRWLYRGATVGGAAFGAYTNPWLARAVLAAVWTSVKVVAGLE